MYSFDSVVRYSECDTRLRLELPALINYLQDSSTFHSEAIGHGVAYLKEHHFCWVITSWHIVIKRTPRFLEPIRISTWCHEVGSVSAKRNFTIDNSDGTRLVEADSNWVVFDTDLKRAIRVPDTEQAFLSDDEPLAMRTVRRKLKPTGEGVALAPITVSKHHLDTNDHVNNGQYVAMAFDAVSEVVDGFDPSDIVVQYRQPAVLGDTIVCVRYEEEASWCVDLTDGCGGRYAICRMLK